MSVVGGLRGRCWCFFSWGWALVRCCNDSKFLVIVSYFVWGASSETGTRGKPASLFDRYLVIPLNGFGSASQEIVAKARKDPK